MNSFVMKKSAARTITDPRTTVRGRWGQCAVAFTVALVEMILRLNRVVHAPYYALFLVGPAALALELWWGSRRAPATVRSSPEVASG